MDNFRQGHFTDAANHFSNTLTEIMKAAAKKFGFRGGQLGQHTMFLDKIGFIHENVREMISRFFSYLAKFRKGQQPSVDEARLLVNLSFSIFGFIAPKISTFKVDSKKASKAKQEIKSYVVQQKEKEAKKIVKKSKKKRVNPEKK